MPVLRAGVPPSEPTGSRKDEPLSIFLDIGVYGARSIPSTYSGYETFLTVLLPELAGRGHRVVMYCRVGEEGNGSYRGVERVVLPAVRTKQLDTLSHGLVAASRARLARHDVVLTVNVANAAFCAVARLTRQPTVLNTDGQEWLRGKWGRAGRTWFRLSARLARSAASAVVADSVGMQRVYAEEFGCPSTVIPYCWTEIDGDGSAAELHQLGLRPGGFLLVAGRLVPENNIERVADGYVAAGLDEPLVVLGAANYDSPVRRHLERLAEQHPNVRLLGHVGDRSLFSALQRDALLYVHAHSVGGINPSLLEAMGNGAHVLAYDTVFNREALGEAGTYFADFTDDLPATLRRLADQDEERSRASRARAEARARSHFSLKAVADAYEDLLVGASERSPWRRTVIATAWDANGHGP